MEVEEHNEEIVKKEEEKKQKRDMDSDSEEDKTLMQESEFMMKRYRKMGNPRVKRLFEL